MFDHNPDVNEDKWKKPETLNNSHSSWKYNFVSLCILKIDVFNLIQTYTLFPSFHLLENITNQPGTKNG